MATIDKPARDDYDSPWREAMAFYLSDFFIFFFPYISKEIDWDKPHAFLDTKLRQMEKEAKLGKREADALIKVYQLGGKETWVLVHIEVQAQHDTEFAQRMFISHYRIFDMFRKPVCSLAILADKSKSWRPTSFTHQQWGTTMLLHFPSKKLQDYNSPEILAQLEKSTNPFAHLVAATLYAQATRPDSKKREQKKYHLVRKLYDLGLGKERIRHFFKLIDWVLTLSPTLTTAFNYKMQQFEKENKMPYITSVEQLGREEGRKDVARRMLSLDFTREQIQQATELSEQELAALEKEREGEQD